MSLLITRAKVPPRNCSYWHPIHWRIRELHALPYHVSSKIYLFSLLFFEYYKFYSKYGPQTSSIGLTWTLVRNAKSYAPPRLTWSDLCLNKIPWQFTRTLNLRSTVTDIFPSQQSRTHSKFTYFKLKLVLAKGFWGVWPWNGYYHHLSLLIEASCFHFSCTSLHPPPSLPGAETAYFWLVPLSPLYMSLIY